MDNEGREDIRLNEVWRACRKLQSAIFTYNYDLSNELRRHDPSCTGLMSKSLFTGILGKYKNIVPLSNMEVNEMTDYFGLRDGRVNYRQFCNVVCVNPHDKKNPKDLSHGLEWNDPTHVNPLAREEDQRRFCLLLYKLALISHIPLLPYFQDYELISGNVGAVTVSHFARVLSFMKINLSDDDFLLLLKRYLIDSHLVNYGAFCIDIHNIQDYLKENNIIDFNLDIQEFPGHLLDIKLPQLASVDGQQIAQKIFPDACNHPKKKVDICDVIKCIQSHVFKLRVRVREFLEGFDIMCNNTITKSQFERGLYAMGIGKYLTQRDFEMLCERYKDAVDKQRIRWRIFEQEIDSVFTVQNLEKMPQTPVQSPPDYIAKLPRKGAVEWQDVDQSSREFCEEVLRKIQMRIRNRRLHLHPDFRSYDKHNCGHVNCNQANQVFIVNAILLSPTELGSLQSRYGNELGFNYTKFLADADPAEYGAPTMKPPATLPYVDCPAKKGEDAEEEITEEEMIKLLSNIKRQAVTHNIPVMDFLQDYDRHREGEILDPDFRRGLHSANINLSSKDMDKLCKIFRSPKRACCILYREFVKELNEVFFELVTSLGDRRKTAVPLNHLANLDCEECFLTFEERTLCSQGLMKLARKPDEISNLSYVMKDFDRQHCGTIRKNHLVRSLTLRDMHTMLSSREFEAVFKCFGHKRGSDIEFNYREFLQMLDILHKTGQTKRNY